MDVPCPCGNARHYRDCCGVFLESDPRPETAEQLMRSRYTAYALQNKSYLLETWHPSTRPAALHLDDTAPVKWLGLLIKRKERGEKNDADGVVEFVARYKIHGKAERLHETSRFVRENDHWYYLDAAG